MGDDMAWRRKRRSTVIVVALVLLAGVSTAVWLLARGANADAGTSADSSPPAGTALSADDRAMLEASLVSEDSQVVAAVLAAGFDDAYLADGGGPLLPPGSTISIDPSTFAHGAELASVDAELTGPEPGSWQLTLAYQDDAWLVVNAVPAP
ncbi:hypothetical protein ACQEVI_23985 [Promicromonospora sp. CA-289599]|uniref:hypothetical protein n=1 Tax=Promicromonospora sp. CA-289599 TaxID=3240014 RepID=UPI003D91B31D